MHWERVADETLASVRRMSTLVDKLLILSRAGAAGLKHELAELRALATEAVDRTQGIAGERGVELRVTPGAAVHADVDAEAIAIVFDNLLRNAIDHAPKGTSVEMTVEAAPEPRIIVADRGPGVPDDQRQRIFEPFARGHHQSDRAAGAGFGLGLAICKRLVEGHGGTISVDDRSGGGARFTVDLPARR
jgi:signal transduction histidine kinase